MLLKDITFETLSTNDYWLEAWIRLDNGTWMEVARATERNNRWAGRFSVTVWPYHSRHKGKPLLSRGDYRTGYLDELDVQCLIMELINNPPTAPWDHPLHYRGGNDAA